MNRNEKILLGVVAVWVGWLVYKVNYMAESIDAIDKVIGDLLEEKEQEFFDDRFEEIIDENDLEGP